MISLIVLKNFSNYPGNWWKARVQHPVHVLEIIGKGDALVGLGFAGQIGNLQKKLKSHEIPEEFQEMHWEEILKFEKIIVCGTPFQIAVWNELLKIPSGTVSTYSDIATAIGSPRAVRAVGTAIGSNPVSIIIPCHRVLPKTGGIGNYYWEPYHKEKLLELEQSQRISLIS